MQLDGTDRAEARADCAALGEQCRTLAGRIGPGLFAGPPEAVAAVLADLAGLRARALYWDGRCTVALAGGLAEAESVDGLQLSLRQQWLALPDDEAAKLLAEPAVQPYRGYLESARPLIPY